MARFLIAIFAVFLSMPALADEDTALLDFGGDAFRAGGSVIHDTTGADDLFMAGDSLLGTADISGSAHMAGREIVMEGVVAGDVYAAGEDISIRGDVTGDVSIAGRALSVGRVGGDVRMAGAELRLQGDIGGYAMVAGESLVFDAAVAGDVRLAVERVDWGEAASITGRLYVYEEELGQLEIPDRVISADRIERREIEEWEGPQPPSWRRAIGGFLMGVVVVAALAAFIAALIPERLAEMRRQVLARPFHTLWLGFLAQSALMGAGVIFAMTLIGLLLTPAMVLLALASGFAGYVVAAYAFGVGLMLAFGGLQPTSIGERALAAGIGALAAGLIGLIPFLGWLFVLALVLAGVGAITIRLFRPVFFADGV